jgi:uncharacterized damage-inducible protein DinB
MTQREALVDDLRRAYGGNAWHGLALVELLRGVTAADAAAHPLAGSHSIWEIVLHMTAWTREVARRLRGGAVQQPLEGDWPPVGETTDQTWTAALADLAAAHADLEQAVLAFPEERLDSMVGPERDPALGTGVSYRVTVSGLAQHDAYHGGTIAMLKRALASRT